MWSYVGWGEERTPTIHIIQIKCWGSFLTPTYEALTLRYRRAIVKGGTYFFTVNLANRKSALLVDEIAKLRLSINKVKKQHPFKLDAMVVLPDHLHAVLTLPTDDHDYSTRWSLIKAGFSRQLPKKEVISKSRHSKGERGIWQRRYWEHLILDDNDYERHVNYIHYNPVKHGYANQAAAWQFSTIHEFISRGVLDKDWGFDGSECNTLFGE